MAPTPSPWTTRRNLLLAARKLAVIQYDYQSPLITTVKNPTTGALVLPDNGFPIGLHSKQQGGRLANAQTIEDIRSHGYGGPTRQIPTERDVTLGLQAQETHRRNLENQYGADFSDVVPDAAGGVHLDIPDLPLNQLSRVVLLGKDDWNGLPIYLAWVGNRVNISETSEQQMTDAALIDYPYTMNFQGEDAFADGNPFFLEIFGPGWKAIQDAGTDTGFGGGS